MGTPFIQHSFHAGEWAPALNARVDLAKYHAAAELLENFFVDYRGGASSRPGTKYVLRCLGDTNKCRLIPFQASFSLGYILQFSEGAMRPFRDGAPVLEPTVNITGATKANPCVVSVVNTYAINDWVFITNVGGMTQLNGKYYIISARTAGTITLHDLFGNPIDSTAYGTYTAGGTTARIYTVPSPYAAADLADLKFTQDVDEMIICHPVRAPQRILFISNTNWTITAISFGTNISPPTGVTAGTTLAAGTVNYGYLVTSETGSSQESVPSSVATIGNLQDIRTTPGSNVVQWNAVAGAAFFNIYKALPGYTFVTQPGASFGFIGTSTGITFVDTNISADFSQTPPVAQNPFVGAGVVSYTVTANGVYTAVPSVTVAPSGGGISSATANAELWVLGTPTVGAGGAGYAANDLINFGNGVLVTVNTVAAGVITSFKAINVGASFHGAITAGSTPTNPVAQVTTLGAGTGATANLVWGVGRLIPVSPGAGYTAAPAVTFSSGAAAATAVLGQSSDLNPQVPGFFQQRLVLGALAGAPQTFYMSQPGAPFNFNITNPVQADNAISGALVSGQLNTIKSMVATQSGLVLLTDRAVWLINGGGGGVGTSDAVTPINISANPHSYNGASDVPPIVANFDILYVQAKGSIVRDVAYNIYSNVYTGTDISVLSSHLFYGFQILGWAWAEEPFKLVWAIRDDGTALSLTFMKEQELIGWAHSVTQGNFLSVATTIESTDFGNVDAVYFIVERVIEGQTVQYIERLAERIFPNGAEDAWCVDSALHYNGPPATSFSGAEHLGGMTVTGVADGAVINPFVMSIAGTFTLALAASKVTLGLAFTPKLKTLALDVNAGDGTVQGREKKISQVTVRVQDTLGLKIGSTFDTLVNMSDLTVGEVGSSTNERVTNLVTGDAQQIVDPMWTTQGQYCIEQPNPWPATILGVIPEVTIGDNTK